MSQYHVIGFFRDSLSFTIAFRGYLSLLLSEANDLRNCRVSECQIMWS